MTASTLPFPETLRAVVEKMQAGDAYVTHDDRILGGIRDLVGYTGHPEPGSGITYLETLAHWRSQRSSLGFADAREMELGLLLRAVERWISPRRVPVAWLVFTGRPQTEHSHER